MRYKLYVMLGNGERRELLFECAKLNEIKTSGHYANMFDEYRFHNWYVKDDLRGRIIPKDEVIKILEK